MEVRDAESKRAASVNDRGQLSAEASMLARMAYIARETGEVFSWSAVSADIDANDTAILVANVSTSKKLYVASIYLYSDVAAQFKIHCPAYPTLAGTAITGVCLNREKALDPTAYALAYADETGNTAANIIRYMRQNEVGTDQFAIEWMVAGAIVLGYHNCIAIDIVTESAAFEANIVGWYE